MKKKKLYKSTLTLQTNTTESWMVASQCDFRQGLSGVRLP